MPSAKPTATVGREFKKAPKAAGASAATTPGSRTKERKTKLPGTAGSSSEAKLGVAMAGTPGGKAAEASATGAAPGKAKKARVAKAAAPADEEATRARKEVQRQKQREALALRAAGGAYKPPKRQRKPKERRKFEERSTAKLIVKRELGKKLRKEKKTAPDVVIVPIFWKGQAGQLGQVISLCTDIERLLTAAGKRVEMDAGHKYTPGQKFAHWEHKGVLLRVEVGPREAERGCCTVARTFTPGEPAHRLENVKVETEAIVKELEFLVALKEEDRDKAAERSVAIKAQTHNGQIFIASDNYSDGTGEPPAAAAAAPEKAKLVKF